MLHTLRSLLAPAALLFAFLAFPAVAPAADGEAEWIWSPAQKRNEIPVGSCFFRKSFEVSNAEAAEIHRFEPLLHMGTVYAARIGAQLFCAKICGQAIEIWFVLFAAYAVEQGIVTMPEHAALEHCRPNCRDAGAMRQK